MVVFPFPGYIVPYYMIIRYKIRDLEGYCQYISYFFAKKRDPHAFVTRFIPTLAVGEEGNVTDDIGRTECQDKSQGNMDMGQSRESK